MLMVVLCGLYQAPPCFFDSLLLLHSPFSITAFFPILFLMRHFTIYVIDYLIPL